MKTAGGTECPVVQADRRVARNNRHALVVDGIRRFHRLICRRSLHGTHLSRLRPKAVSVLTLGQVMLRVTGLVELLAPVVDAELGEVGLDVDVDVLHEEHQGDQTASAAGARDEQAEESFHATLLRKAVRLPRWPVRSKRTRRGPCAR